VYKYIKMVKTDQTVQNLRSFSHISSLIQRIF
jgi:hypothetical protein